MFWSKKGKDLDRTTVILSVVTALALLAAVGAMRWAWILFDEQVQLRKDYNELMGRQEQLEIQFDFWDQRIMEERKQLRGEVR